MATATTSPFDASTTSETVTSAFSQQIQHKTFLITGVSPNGLGLTTALALAPHEPKLLILAGRSTSTLSTSLSLLKDSVPSVHARTLLLDLSSLKAVRAAAEEVCSWDEVKEGGIDVLVNNAGIMSTPWGKSEEGVERQFAVNHLGPWLFTNLLLFGTQGEGVERGDKEVKSREGPVMKAKGRVVFLASLGHTYGGVRWGDVNFEDGKVYDPDTAYGQSKTANILNAIALAHSPSLNAAGVTAFSVHPGLILTNLSNHIELQVFVDKGYLDSERNVLVATKTHSQGAATTLVAALDPSIKEKNGAYMQDCRVEHDGPWEEYAKGRENAERLWKLSEELVGESFEL